MMPHTRKREACIAMAAVLLLTVAACCLITCSLGVEPADLVLLDGKIVTVDDEIPEAEALAVRGGRIVAVGGSNEIRGYVGDNTTVLELGGKLAIPGFIEGHAHFSSLGKSKMRLKLAAAANWGEIVAMVADAVSEAEPGDWILGRGWHQEKWDMVPEPNIDGLPFHNALTEVSPDNPVYLTHASGHSSIGNAKVMEAGLAYPRTERAGLASRSRVGRTGVSVCRRHQFSGRRSVI
jgi:predicted amidohydrolase YtcJ